MLSAGSPSGPDFLLVCGCKGTANSVTFPRNNPSWDKPKIAILSLPISFNASFGQPVFVAQMTQPLQRTIAKRFEKKRLKSLEVSGKKCIFAAENVFSLLNTTRNIIQIFKIKQL